MKMISEAHRPVGAPDPVDGQSAYSPVISGKWIKNIPYEISPNFMMFMRGLLEVG